MEQEWHFSNLEKIFTAGLIFQQGHTKVFPGVLESETIHFVHAAEEQGPYGLHNEIPIQFQFFDHQFYF